MLSYDIVVDKRKPVTLWDPATDKAAVSPHRIVKSHPTTVNRSELHSCTHS
jgi:hypothetical protein